MEKFISDFVKNNTKTIFKDLSLPQKKNLRALIYALFRHQTGLLSELSINEKILPKNLAQKFSYHLEKVDLKSRVEMFCDQKILKILETNCVIAYDLSDILKDSAKKIEGLGKIFDGSERKIGNGFFLHGVGVMGLLWRLEIHDGDRSFLPQIRKQILEKLIKITKPFDPIFALDRGNDDKKLFEFLIQKKAKFIIRIKKNRQVILANTGEVVAIESLIPGRYEILLKTEKTTQKKFPEYQKYLVIVSKNKKSKTPIRKDLLQDSWNDSNSKAIQISFCLHQCSLQVASSWYSNPNSAILSHMFSSVSVSSNALRTPSASSRKNWRIALLLLRRQHSWKSLWDLEDSCLLGLRINNSTGFECRLISVSKLKPAV